MTTKLQEAVTEEYLARNIEVTPTYPRVLVRLLPREQVSRGGIVLPEGKQNKPNLEGIVVSTYKPFLKKLIKSDRQNWERKSSKFALVDEDENITDVWMSPPVSAGDHIIFPAMEFGITPVWPLDDGVGDYRLVPEEHILGILSYKKQSDWDWLLDLIGHGVAHEELATKILDKAMLVRKDLVPKTTSGA